MTILYVLGTFKNKTLVAISREFHYHSTVSITIVLYIIIHYILYHSTSDAETRIPVIKL